MMDPYRKALHLEYFTVGYNIGEAVAALVVGLVAASIALVGFGLDSIVESLSALVLIWRLKKHGSISQAEEAHIETRAQLFVALTFLILAAYICYESIEKLVRYEPAEPTLLGIIIAVLSIIIMPLLASAKLKLGRKMGSKALVADAKETVVCSFLSVALLLGLLLNYIAGLWQADPVAGFVIVAFLVKEGREGWTEAREAREE